MREKTSLTKARTASSAHAVPVAHVLSALSSKRTLGLLLWFATSWAAAGVEGAFGTYPFGIAMLASVTGVTAMLPVLLGALLGSARIPTVGGVHALLITLLAVTRLLLSAWLMSPRNVLPHLPRLSSLIAGRRGSHVPAVRRSEEVTMLRESIGVRMSLASCTALFVGTWSVVRGGFSYYDLLGTIVSILLTPLLVYFLYAATERRMRTSPMRELGLYVTCAALTHVLQSLLGGAFSAGIAFAFAASVVTAVEYGLYRGVLLGISCGTVLDVRLLPCFALSAVMATLFRGHAGVRTSAAVGRGTSSPVLGILAAGATSAAWAVYAAGFDGVVTVLAPIVTACAVLAPLYSCGAMRRILPENVFGTESRRTTSEVAMAYRARDGMDRRLTELSECLTSVSAVLEGMSERLSRPGRDELYGICETSFGSYCRGCALRGRCGEARFSKLGAVIEAMTRELLRDGVVSAGTVPASLASHCFNIGRILDDINRAAGERIAERRSRDRLAVTALDLSLAGELMREAHEAEEAECRLDRELSRRLRQLLTYRDFGAGDVLVYGDRVKRIFVRDIELTATRMGGDDIRRLFEEVSGIRLSQPEFSVDGGTISMTMHAVSSFTCTSGRAVCAANAARGYGISGDTEVAVRSEGDTRDEEVLCRERFAERVEERGSYSEYEIGESSKSSEACEGEEVRIDVTDSLPFEEYSDELGNSGEERGDVSGDAITSFEAWGRYYMVISDGMGSGREAALTSGVCASILERLIRSGAGLETALKLLNGMIRASGRECSATVDIAEIDLVTGEARFIKSGAAPSFVLRDGSIFRLQSKTVPIGILRALDAEMIRFNVMSGDRVVMVSDGAARSYEEVPWLLDMMTSDAVILRGSPRAAATRIVREAARRGSTDDITAGVICIGGG